MKSLGIVGVVLLLGSTPLFAQNNKPILKVEKDGFPAGHSSPEGVACDLARAFIQRDGTLFKSTCIKPFGGGENKKNYAAFLTKMGQSFLTERKKTTPSPGGPKTITKVFAARPLSANGPASYGYAVCGFKDVRFVDVSVTLQNGKSAMNRTLVIQDTDGQWYVHPLPASSPLLSTGLNEEEASTKDFSENYTIRS